MTDFSCLNRYFDKILVLNLDERADRMRQFTASLPGLDFERVSAVPNRGDKDGDRRSKLKLIKYAAEQRFRRVLLFEDDAEPTPECTQENMEQSLETANAFQWGFLYLGAGVLGSYSRHGSICEMTRIKPWWKSGTILVHAVAVDESMYDLCNVLLDYHRRPSDVIFQEAQRYTTTLVANPLLFIQRKDYSDQRGAVVDINDDSHREHIGITHGRL